MATQIITYKGLLILKPDPLESGGQLIQTNFKSIADSLESFQNNITNINNDLDSSVVDITSNQTIIGSKKFQNIKITTAGNQQVLMVNANGKIVTTGKTVQDIINDAASPDLSDYYTKIEVNGHLAVQQSQILDLQNIDTQIQNITGSLQSQILEISGGSDAILIGEDGIQVVESPEHTWTISVDSSFNSIGSGTQDITSNETFIPSIDNTYSLGNSVNSWSNLWISGSEITVDGGTLKVDGVEISGGSGSGGSDAILIGEDGIQVVESPSDTWTISVSGDYATETLVQNVSGNLQSQIDSNDSDITVAQGNISNNTNAILINSTDISDLQDYNTQNDSDILELQNFDSQVADITGDFATTTLVENVSGDLQNQIDDIDTPNELGSGTVNITSNESIIPSVSGAYDLGSLERPWRSGYFTNNSLYLGEDKLSVENGSLKLNDAQTLGGSSNVLQSFSASDSSDLEFDVSDVDGTVEFLLEGIVPATDSVDLTIEVSDDNGATWEAANYQWSNVYGVSSANPAAFYGDTHAESGDTDALYLTGTVGSDSGEALSGRVLLDDPSNASTYKTFSFCMSYAGASGGQSIASFGSGLWKGSTNAITNVRFKFDSGNIESGTIKMIDPTVAQTGSPSLYEDSEVRIPGEWWQDPNNTSDYYPKYRKVVDLGSLPNASSASVAHGISNMHLDSVELGGRADNGTAVITIPYVWVDDVGSQIWMRINGANIDIDTGTTDRSGYTGYATLEYAKTTDTPVTRDQAYGNGGGGATLVAPAIYTSDSGQSISNATNQIINFEDVEEDDDSLVTTGASWKWTAPKDMWVTVESNMVFGPSAGFSAGQVLVMDLYVNDVKKRNICYDEMDADESITKSVGGSTKVKVNKDDYIHIEIFQNSGSSVTLRNESVYNWICITEYDTGIRET